MAFSRRIPAPTKEQQRRQDLIRDLGCLVARLRGHGFVPCEIHHLTDCGRTISQDHTIGLNPWSHRGVSFNDLTYAQCRELFGPSLAKGSKIFHAEFGSNEELLEMQNQLLDKYKSIISI